MHNRRKFIRNISLTAGLFAAGKMLGGNNDNRVTGEIPTIILPPKLQKGDLVALMAPAGAIFNDDTVPKATAAVEAMGFRVKVGETAKTKTGYLAGDDEFRAKEFMAFISDKEVKAIIALRGGWGCARMLPFIDMTMIPDNPKIISGFSDITTLLLALYAKIGLVTFHGPVGNSTWEGATTENFLSVVQDAELPFRMTNPQVQVIHAGYAKGILLGGNLSIICSLIGTGFLPDFKDAILFLEETEEEPYRVDRLLTQLDQSGILGKLAGVVFGTCAKCEPEEPEKSFTLDQVLDHHFKNRNYPVIKGFAIGHIKDKFTLPVGIMAELNTEKGALTLIEPAVR
ncbi:MAG TPA: LD-carboxypeptidase [Bacteroidia bacterium]|nr:LD-carboxypeptidase [Bacteroidia bacterium]